jgi:hypothetical protein
VPNPTVLRRLLLFRFVKCRPPLALCRRDSLAGGGAQRLPLSQLTINWRGGRVPRRPSATDPLANLRDLPIDYIFLVLIPDEGRLKRSRIERDVVFHENQTSAVLSE